MPQWARWMNLMVTSRWYCNAKAAGAVALGYLTAKLTHKWPRNSYLRSSHTIINNQNVFKNPESLSFWEQIQASAERAASRKGQIPQDHPPRQPLISQFLLRLRQREALASSPLSEMMNSMLHTTQVPPPYPPSIRSINDLRPLKISGMQLETHHHGRKVIIRALTPPDRMTAVLAIVEDEEGTATILQLYNQPEEADVGKWNIIRPLDVYIIKEPFFKIANDGGYSLRVDHVSDIIRLSDDDERIPQKWRKPQLDPQPRSQELRMRGNSAVQEKNWSKAEHLYTAAIRAATTTEHDRLAYLKLGYLEEALEDASKRNGIGKLSEKGFFREAKALYALGRYEECFGKLQAAVGSNPDNKDVLSEINRVKERLREKKAGTYNFNRMYKQAKATPPIIDCATYVGPIAVRASPGRCRGLFTTKPVKAGELLLCEKAFAYHYAGDDNSIGRQNNRVLVNLDTKTLTTGGQAYLIPQIVQKIYHNPESSSQFKELYRGDYRPVARSEVDGKPIVDTFLVERIINRNSFGAPRSSRQEAEDMDTNEGEERVGHAAVGVWCMASYINHSCISNCCRAFIGDMQIVRASRDLNANTELVFPYTDPTELQSYKDTQKALSSWGFACGCRLCLDKESTSEKVLHKRQILVREFDAALNSSHNSTSRLSRAQTLLEELGKTYPTKGVPHPELWMRYLSLGIALHKQGNQTEAIQLTLKGLEVLGYVIVACPPGTASKVPTLKIITYGQADKLVPAAFVLLIYAYRELAPQLSVVSRQYAEIFHNICYGERLTFDSDFEKFRYKKHKTARGSMEGLLRTLNQR
ncbi:hypothetical protein AAE478_002642 [Parahypoxylon ruwenzoriense]